VAIPSASGRRLLVREKERQRRNVGIGLDTGSSRLPQHECCGARFSSRAGRWAAKLTDEPRSRSCRESDNRIEEGRVGSERSRVTRSGCDDAAFREWDGGAKPVLTLLRTSEVLELRAAKRLLAYEMPRRGATDLGHAFCRAYDRELRRRSDPAIRLAGTKTLTRGDGCSSLTYELSDRQMGSERA